MAEGQFSEQRISHYRSIFPISVTLTEVPDWSIFRNNNIYVFCIFLGPENDKSKFLAIFENSCLTSPPLICIAFCTLPSPKAKSAIFSKLGLSTFSNSSRILHNTEFRRFEFLFHCLGCFYSFFSILMNRSKNKTNLKITRICSCLKDCSGEVDKKIRFPILK